jgi:hypothetical protein
MRVSSLAEPTSSHKQQPQQQQATHKHASTHVATTAHGTFSVVVGVVGVVVAVVGEVILARLASGGAGVSAAAAAATTTTGVRRQIANRASMPTDTDAYSRTYRLTLQLT